MLGARDHSAQTGGHQQVAVVLANPPLAEGRRTLARVETARRVLDATSAVTVNLFAEPSASVTDISVLGAEEQGWLAARSALMAALEPCTAVLLAYGVSEPTGLARAHHRDQVRWLWGCLALAGIPALQIGDGPRHPSRWQRWTARHHPGVPFIEALALSVRPAAPPITVGGS